MAYVDLRRWHEHGLCPRDLDKLNRQSDRACAKPLKRSDCAASTVTYGPLYSKKYGHQKY